MSLTVTLPIIRKGPLTVTLKKTVEVSPPREKDSESSPPQVFKRGDPVRTREGANWDRNGVKVRVPSYKGGRVTHVTQSGEFVQVSWGVGEVQYHAARFLEIDVDQKGYVPPAAPVVPTVDVLEEALQKTVAKYRAAGHTVSEEMIPKIRGILRKQLNLQ